MDSMFASINNHLNNKGTLSAPDMLDYLNGEGDTGDPEDMDAFLSAMEED